MDYITSLGTEIGEELDPQALPNEPADDLLRSYAVLALALGSAVTTADVHNAWVAWMVPRHPQHPALVHFQQLDRTTRDQDQPFVAAIRAVAERRGLVQSFGRTTTPQVAHALMPKGPPSTPAEREEFFELYRLMVGSSEALVGRRQAVNTFFLTMNGLLLTAVGLFLRVGADDQFRLEAAAIVVLAIAGATLCAAWRTLIISFGQLNTGKFKIINSMERELAASIFAAEWEALERGQNPKVYRTFTSREIYVPVALGLLYIVTAVLSGTAALGWWHPGI